VALALLVGVACVFAPDLSRFDECNEQQPCKAGYTCLTDVGRCLPDCGADCAPLEDGGTDAGHVPDGGDAGEADAGHPLLLDPTGLARAIEEVPYSHPFQAEGGTPPYAFAALEALPAGLWLDGGTLSGTPDASGEFVLRIQVTDQGTPPQQAQRDYPFLIRQRLRVAGPETLALAPINEPYQEGIQATGGLPPYSFTLTGDSLPGGLFLSRDGGVSGTAQGSTSRNFGVQVTDSDTPPQTASARLNISTFECSAFCIRTRGLPEGRVGTPYAYTLQHSKGTSPIVWSVKQGVLLAGLALSSNGVLSGTPTQAGEVELTLGATDSTVLFPASDQVVVTLRVR
jgi:hypothetical protein